MLRQQRCAIHASDEQRLRRRNLRRGERAAEKMPDAVVKTFVCPKEGPVLHISARTGLCQKRGQRGACPQRGPDGLIEPGHGAVTGIMARPPISGAFQRHGHVHLWPFQKVGKAKVQWRAHRATDTQPEAVTGQVGHIEMGQKVVRTRRGDIMAQQFQRQAGIAVGQPTLFE